jgi:exodeoxyribonuclease V alpha subunit
VSELDPLDSRRVQRAPAMLAGFNELGVLAAADVHVAARLAELAGERDQSVVLAVALAVRAPRLGHVFVDLATIRDTAIVDEDEPIDISALPWPTPADWTARVAASGLVAIGSAGEPLDHGDSGAGWRPSRPLRLEGTRLYLDRYWRDELLVAGALKRSSAAAPPRVHGALLADGLERLFADRPDASQRLAAACAVLRRFAVLAGGPGTGKTTTVARIVALLLEQSAAGDDGVPVVALAAPTGRAAARLEEAVHEEAHTLAIDRATRATLLGLQASTVHRLLGWQPGSHSRFRHNGANPLPHDIVIVDETSMVPLSLMARLVEAIRTEARLVLVGDPAQLTSVEAGAVLGDIVGPAARGLIMSRAGRAALSAATGAELTAREPPAGVRFGDGVVVLDRVHRFGGAIAALADAVRGGAVDAVLEVLAAGADEVVWVPDDHAPEAVRTRALAAARTVTELARAGDGHAAIRALGAFRLLCAHRRGPDGVAAWTARIAAWLAQEIGGLEPDERSYAGRPLLVTANDYELQLYNGDMGVVIDRGGAARTAVFERSGRLLAFTPARLGAVETAYAMTIHKSQGSQCDVAAVLLPAPGSRILTRELLYTGVTRARERLILVGTEASVRAAVERPVARASGLRERLWG